MQVKIAIKVAIIVVISLLLWIPLAMIGGLIGERQALRDGVLRDIAREAVDTQQIIGPVITVPYKRHIIEVTTTEIDGQWRDRKWEHIEEGKLALLPDQLSVAGRLLPEERHRGIYKAILYGASLDISGRFVIPANFGMEDATSTYEFGRPRLVLGISDPRGIGNGPRLDWEESQIEVMPGAEASGFHNGVSAELPDLGTAGRGYDFRFAVKLQGLSRIDFVPTGKQSIIALTSPWPNPSFFGRYMPTSEISEAGFTAEWRTSFLSTNAKRLYEQCFAGGAASCTEFVGLAHGVALYQPADVYQQLERSAKYGFLFIGLTFIAFFLFEILKQLAIHPIQYGLVGVALATFYLLLTSLSEQVSFLFAYTAASVACVALVGFYVCHVLRSLVRGLAFAGLLAGLYGMLYVLVRTEESSLLTGALALFVLLAIVMIGTRKVNWYALQT
jgi:inner membrane protein